MKILVAYDGTLSAKDALRHGLQRVRDKGGELIALHVFNRDILPYYDASPQVNDKLAKEADKTVNEAEGIARQEGKGLKVTIVHREGSPEREILSFAKN
jgi:nucleotide-binding universal stress UspA family protein